MPSKKKQGYVTKTGRTYVTVAVDPDVYDKLRKDAEAADRSMAAQVRLALRRAFQVKGAA